MLVWPAAWLTSEATTTSNRLEEQLFAAKVGEFPVPPVVLDAARFEESIADQCSVAFRAAGHVFVATDGSSHRDVPAYTLVFPMESAAFSQGVDSKGQIALHTELATIRVVALTGDRGGTLQIFDEGCASLACWSEGQLASSLRRPVRARSVNIYLLVSLYMGT